MATTSAEKRNALRTCSIFAAFPKKGASRGHCAIWSFDTPTRYRAASFRFPAFVKSFLETTGCGFGFFDPFGISAVAELLGFFIGRSLNHCRKSNSRRRKILIESCFISVCQFRERVRDFLHRLFESHGFTFRAAYLTCRVFALPSTMVVTGTAWLVSTRT